MKYSSIMMVIFFSAYFCFEWQVQPIRAFAALAVATFLVWEGYRGEG